MQFNRGDEFSTNGSDLSLLDVAYCRKRCKENKYCRSSIKSYTVNSNAMLLISSCRGYQFASYTRRCYTALDFKWGNWISYTDMNYPYQFDEYHTSGMKNGAYLTLGSVHVIN